MGGTASYPPHQYLSHAGELITNASPLHKQSKILYKGNQIYVDKGMVRVLQYFWNIGIDTCYSCQGNVGTQPLYILFSNHKILTFLSLIKDTKLYNFVKTKCFVRRYDYNQIYFSMDPCSKNDFEIFLYSQEPPKSLLITHGN